jgi:colanic acid/amylovoran biosynthesis glycosyltransferase
MKIAFVVHSFPIVSETFILHQITGLMDRGHEIDIYAQQAGDEGLVHETVARYGLRQRTRYLPATPRRRLSRIAGACVAWPVRLCRTPRRALRAANVFHDGWQQLACRVFWSGSFDAPQQYDIIHCHFGPNGVQAVWWRKMGLLSGKIVTTFHGVDVNRHPGCFRRAGYGLLFREGEVFTVNSEFTGRNVEALGCPHEKIVPLPVGLDPRDYPYAERRMTPAREIRLLTVARLVECKGLAYAIRAFAPLARRWQTLCYDIVGDGPLRLGLEQLVREMGLSGRVRFLGWQSQEQVRQLYGRADLFVLPSVTSSDGQQEAQGLVLLEAQASGLPVVATHIGGIPESVVEGQSGFLVPERHAEALAERLTYLLEHPEIWTAMGRAGRSYVESHFDLNKLNDRLVGLYDRLLCTPGSSGSTETAEDEPGPDQENFRGRP